MLAGVSRRIALRSLLVAAYSSAVTLVSRGCAAACRCPSGVYVTSSYTSARVLPNEQVDGTYYQSGTETQDHIHTTPQAAGLCVVHFAFSSRCGFVPIPYNLTIVSRSLSRRSRKYGFHLPEAGRMTFAPYQQRSCPAPLLREHTYTA